MRIVFGVLSLLVVLAVVSWLARTQVKAVASPAEVAVPMPDGTTQRMNPKEVQEQYKKALEDAMNAAHSRASEE
ncbi:MAG TPA: hypothetical protein VIN35_04525 [Hydrogenophaga sp.]